MSDANPKTDDRCFCGALTPWRREIGVDYNIKIAMLKIDRLVGQAIRDYTRIFGPSKEFLQRRLESDVELVLMELVANTRGVTGKGDA